MHVILARVLHTRENVRTENDGRLDFANATTQRHNIMIATELEEPVEQCEEHGHDEGKGLLGEESSQKQGALAAKVLSTGLSWKFWFASAVNCLSTASTVSI